jgi:IS4 transposase
MVKKILDTYDPEEFLDDVVEFSKRKIYEVDLEGPQRRMLWDRLIRLILTQPMRTLESTRGDNEGIRNSASTSWTKIGKKIPVPLSNPVTRPRRPQQEPERVGV